MKKIEIGYTKDWKLAPMAFWVHIEKDGKPWYEAKEFDPPAPKPDLNGAYKAYSIEIDGFNFIFTSIAQLENCIDILSRKLLPTTIELNEKRNSGMGPNQHWLSRLPAKVKPWSYRQKAVKFLKEAKAEIEEFNKKHY